MPTYRYKAVEGESSCETCAGFAILQPLSEPSLTECPQCKTPVRRVLGGAVCVTSQQWSEKKLLSDDNLRDKGFKKLVRQSNGNYVDILRT